MRLSLPLYENVLTLLFRNYLIVLFRDQPFELWDLRTFNLIRRLPKKCPRILALVGDALPYELEARLYSQDWSPNVVVMKKGTGETSALINTKLNTSTDSEHEQTRTLNDSE